MSEIIVPKGPEPKAGSFFDFDKSQTIKTEIDIEKIIVKKRAIPRINPIKKLLAIRDPIKKRIKAKIEATKNPTRTSLKK